MWSKRTNLKMHWGHTVCIHTCTNSCPLVMGSPSTDFNIRCVQSLCLCEVVSLLASRLSTTLWDNHIVSGIWCRSLALPAEPQTFKRCSVALQCTHRATTPISLKFFAMHVSKNLCSYKKYYERPWLVTGSTKLNSRWPCEVTGCVKTAPLNRTIKERTTQDSSYA